MSEEHGEEEAACQSERYRKYHGHRQDVRLVLCRQDEVDEDEAQGEDDTCGIRCFCFLTSQTLIVVGITLRQDVVGNLLGCLQCLTRGVAVSHRCRHIDRCKQVEAVDVRRSVDALHATELLNGRHACRSANIDALQRLWRHTSFGRCLNHDAVQLTIAVEVGGIQTTIVTLQRGEYRSRRDTCLLALGNVHMQHILRIVRVVGGHGHLELWTFVQLRQVFLDDAKEFTQVATGTVLHNQRDTTICRETWNHRRCEGDYLSVLDVGGLQVNLSQHTRCIVGVEEETVDTVTLPESAEFPPESLLTFLEWLQLDDECCLIGTRTSDEVISLNLLTALYGGVGS